MQYAYEISEISAKIKFSEVSKFEKSLHFLIIKIMIKLLLLLFKYIMIIREIQGIIDKVFE